MCVYVCVRVRVRVRVCVFMYSCMCVYLLVYQLTSLTSRNPPQPLYFQSTIADNCLFLVAELVTKSSSKNSLAPTRGGAGGDAERANDEKLTTAAWGFYRLFPSNEKLLDVSEGVKTPAKK